MKVVISGGFIRRLRLLYVRSGALRRRMKRMAAWRRAIEMSLGDADVVNLRSIAQSRMEPASRRQRARILLSYWKQPSFFAVGQALGVHHQTVQRCVERAAVEGPIVALDDRPRPGREPTITVKPRRGWCRWRAGRRRTWAIRTNCGQRGFWPVTLASMDRRKGTRASPILRRALCARFSTRRR